ncbi:MAG: hypothetical protein ACE5OS_01955 [Anaerolineae bacterium]
MFKHKQCTYLLGPGRRFAFPFVYIAILLLFLLPASANAQPTGYQEYYVLGYEEHIWRAFDIIYDGGSVPGQICSTVSLVATADYQVVYYDHWEDGYEADLFNPVQSSTEVYTLTVGASLSLTSTQSSGPAINRYVPVASGRDPADIRYDGGDRIITSGGPVALTHAMWPLNTSWVGGAWEVYSRQAYVDSDSHSYRVPIGEDLYLSDPDAYGDFRNVYLQLGAFEDNTAVSIDNGTDVVNLTLDRGQSYSSMGYINSISAPTITINAGTAIRSSKPIQAGLVTGADSPPFSFQGRFLIVQPERQWGADYVLPVSSGYPGDEAEIYLSNPNDFEITVNAYDRFAQTTFVISPTAYISSTVPYSEKRGSLYVPVDTAVRFTSPDGVFGVVVCADTSDQTYDWGFSGIPARYLTRDYYVPWAPGSYNIPPAENGSPVWVTPLADGTIFYVDFSPLDGVVDQTFALNVLEQRRIFDPDNDNTGMHVWATGDFAVAWGEDPRTAGTGNPYLDLGFATLPLQQRWLEPVLALDKTAEPTVLPATGGAVTFTLVAQAQEAPLVNVDITDTLPISWTYVSGSTHVAYPDGGAGNPEPTLGNRTLYWDLSADLDLNQSLTLTFQAQIATAGSVGATIYDGFEDDSYSGGENWASSWQEGGENDGPHAGNVVVINTTPFLGDYHLRIVSSTLALSRTADLSGFTLPTLRFMRQIDAVESGDVFYLDVSNGSAWTTVLAWTDGDQEGDYVQEVVDLVPYAGATTAIRFRSGGTVDGDDYLYVDQVEVYDAVAVNVNRGEAVGRHEYADVLFNPTDEATVYISPLNLTKSVSSAQAEIGDTLVYTLSYANLSDSITATNVNLRDVVPIQYVTFQSASDGGSYDPTSGTITWTLGTLAPGTNGTETFAVTVNNFVEEGTVIGNRGYIASDRTVEAGSNVAQTAIRAPDVEFAKSGPTVAGQGQVITYTLSYENVGGVAATDVVISDTIPLSTTYVSGSMAINAGNGWIVLTDATDGDQGAYISPTLVITPGVTPGTVSAGEAGQIRFSVRLDDDLPAGALIQNWATLDRRLDIPRESNLAVTRISSLLFGKEAEQQAVTPGGVISYSLTYENVSTTITQTGVYVQEPIPDYTSLISVTESGGNQVEYSCDNGATWATTLPITPVTHVRWYDAELPASTQVTVGFAVQVTATLPPNTTIQNIAHISSTETAEYLSEWIPSNQVEVATVDLWVEKSVNQPIARVGDLISYTISYGNHGSADVLGVQIVDTVPVSTTCSAGSIWGAGANDSGVPDLVWNVGTVAAGASAQEVGYAVVLDSGLEPGAIITNTAAISSSLGLVMSDPATVVVGADLAISKTAIDLNGAPIYPRDEIEYRVVVTNTHSIYTQSNVVIADPAPANTTLVAESVTCTSGATCEAVGVAAATAVLAPRDFGGMAVANIDHLGPGDVLTLTFRVTVNDGVSSIGGNIGVTESDSQSAQETEPVYPPSGGTVESGLVIGKTAVDLNDALLRAGETVEYRILVTNTNATHAQTSVTISDTVPTSTTLVAGSVACSPGARCDESGGVVTATIGTLGPGDVLTLTFQVTVNGDVSAIGGNVAAVESDNQNRQATESVYPPSGETLYIRVYLPFVTRNYRRGVNLIYLPVVVRDS